MSHATSPHGPAVLPLPRLVFRVAFAGNRSLPEGAQLHLALQEVWKVLGQRLAEIAPSVPLSAGLEPPVSAYFSSERPLLRLITGLAEGADALAWQTLQTASADSSQPFSPHLDTELAAVLPCSLIDYRKDREPSHLPVFDTQVTDCAYVVELDGLMNKDGSDLSKERRARGFRAQSAVLLRQADFFVAVADPGAPSKPGGTLETVRNALDFDLPVIFVHAVTGEVRLLDAIEDLAAAFAHPSSIPWQTTLRDWITKVIADPDTITPDEPARAGQVVKPNKGQLTLNEFFYVSTSPPTHSCGKRRSSLHEKSWGYFSNYFKSPVNQIPQVETVPFSTWRTRSKELNYHYSGLYRGTFFLNSLRAVLAVACAALTLVLLGIQHSPQASALKTLTDKLVPQSAPATELIAVGPEPQHMVSHDGIASSHQAHVSSASSSNQPVSHEAVNSGPPFWLISTLFGLAVFKLYLVFSIYRNTHSANHGGWNEKAVDYRYLAERLRSLYCLPLLGSDKPPAPARPLYSSRIARQSAIDWLFDAIVRTHSPATSSHVQTKDFTTTDGRLHRIPTLIIKPPQALVACSQWLDSQTHYHAKSRDVMLAMHQWAEKWGALLGKIVIAIVSFDILVLLADVFGILPHGISRTLHAAAPWLVFLTALLPAAVAGLNAIRFQSECRRLADRSDFMVKVLTGRRTQLDRLQQTISSATATPATDPASWTTESLRLAELIASDFAQEVSEWSVLYGKEVHEP